MGSILSKVFGSRNERLLKTLSKTVKKINALEKDLQALSDEQLAQKTIEFKARLKEGEALKSLLPEAFAVVREASVRVLGMRHFDVQLIGGMVLNSGRIAEMRTGEGKTLVATLPAYLNALSECGVHVITVNDYLVQRDAAEMEPLFKFLGMSTGVIVADMEPPARRAAYDCDITYGTNNEFGFDYLRDNMAFTLLDQVQRKLNFAIVDEVDSVLVDEARTPLIISGQAEDSSQLYTALNTLIPQLVKRETEDGPGDYYLDEKAKQAFLTDDGHHNLEVMLAKAGILKEGDSLYSPANVTMMHYISAVLRAHTLFQLDVDYMIKDNEVMIVDEHTGRAMPGRRWSDGLHQAIEAKEGVNIQQENQTLASITFQNYFRLYNTLSGMTGTADTEAYEFHQIYGLEVIVIPTNRPMVRKDHPDVVFLTEQEKFEAIVQELNDRKENGQPVLVGTASIETSERLAAMLKKAKVQHEVLNAKQHEREANIIVEAGRPGTITIATNMAGRGTDIVLGGNWKAEIEALENPSDADIEKIKADWKVRHDAVLAAGGLHILGTERHESRRIDNQLRGRSGRQGDAGSSRFYLSLEDNLLRIFAGPWVRNMMAKLGLGKGEAIESRMVSNQIAKAQKKVENHNFDIRKALLEYDDVASDQRKVVYVERQKLLSNDDVSDIMALMREEVVQNIVYEHMPPGSLEEQWDVDGLEKVLQGDYALKVSIADWLKEDEQLNEESVIERVLANLTKTYESKLEQTEQETMRQFEKSVLLQTLDSFWREQLSAMDHLRQSINLRGYAQKDPKQEYKKESFNLFTHMLDHFRREVISILSKVEVREPEDVAQVEAQRRSLFGSMHFEHASLNNMGTQVDDAVQQKVGRNEPCPCGSGKKFKQCHGKIT